jgi:transcriptional regulator with XRE-family HTH domain
MAVPRNSSPVTVAFGRRVRELRQEHGWTVQKLADVTGLGPSGLWRVESGDNTTLATAGKIADALGVPLASMLDPESCAHCHGAPRRGWICGTCGAAGAEVPG